MIKLAPPLYFPRECFLYIKKDSHTDCEAPKYQSLFLTNTLNVTEACLGLILGRFTIKTRV